MQISYYYPHSSLSSNIDISPPTWYNQPLAKYYLEVFKMDIVALCGIIIGIVFSAVSSAVFICWRYRESDFSAWEHWASIWADLVSSDASSGGVIDLIARAILFVVLLLATPDLFSVWRLTLPPSCDRAYYRDFGGKGIGITSRVGGTEQTARNPSTRTQML